MPQGHKVALSDIAEGEPVRRYNEVIGTAAKPILAGEWVDEARIHMPTPPELDNLELATAVPAPQAPLEGYTFEGFRNPDGSVGTKNVLAISTSVQCVAGTLQFAIKRIKAELLPKYPNVDDVVGLTHNYGCGVAINAPLAIVPIRTLQNLALNPNFGGEVMVVGLGCEKLIPERLLPEGVDGSVVRMQDEAFDGFGAIVDAIMAMADARLAVLNRRRRETCPASDLVIGLQCGGSDAFSGVTANPALGFAADLLVRAGATVMFSEVTEVRDAIHLLTRRAANEDVGRALIREMDWYDAYLAKGDADRSANTTPGNKKGGLANIVEKSLGSIVKSGTSAIVDVLSPGERVRKKGMVVCGHARQRLHLRHVAARLRHDAAGVHHRTRHALWACGRSRHQGLDAHRAGAALEGFDRLRRRPHRHRRGHDRGNRLGPVPPDPRGCERPHQGVVRPLGHSQRFDPIHAGAGDVALRKRASYRFT